MVISITPFELNYKKTKMKKENKSGGSRNLERGCAHPRILMCHAHFSASSM